MQLLVSNNVGAGWGGSANLLDEGMQLYRAIRAVQRVSLEAYRGGAAARPCEAIPQALYGAADSLRETDRERGGVHSKLTYCCAGVSY